MVLSQGIPQRLKAWLTLQSVWVATVQSALRLDNYSEYLSTYEKTAEILEKISGI